MSDNWFLRVLVLCRLLLLLPPPPHLRKGVTAYPPKKSVGFCMKYNTSDPFMCSSAAVQSPLRFHSMLQLSSVRLLLGQVKDVLMQEAATTPPVSVLVRSHFHHETSIGLYTAVAH